MSGRELGSGAVVGKRDFSEYTASYQLIRVGRMTEVENHYCSISEETIVSGTERSSSVTANIMR